ncbi:MAG: AAA family ATPase, partial [Calditrichaceae bacterium]
MVKEVIERLKIIQNRISENLPQSIRPYCRGIKPESRGILFAGPRGVGKTTYILQSIKDRPYFYLSADNPLVGTVTLYDLVEAIFLQGYEGVVIDEIHFGHNWSAHLKALYDSFPGKILWASDSSSVFLRSGISDLSRRFKIIALPLLSLREFIALNEGLDFDPLDPFSVSAAGAAKIVSKVNVLRIFQNYIRYGFRPIYLEGPADYADKVMNTVYKTMQMDIPFLIPRLTENHLRLMHAIVGYLGMSVIPQLNISNLTAEWAL